jgi:hypothetical protein
MYKTTTYGRIPCGRPRHRWEENTKIYFGNLECGSV